MNSNVTRYIPTLVLIGNVASDMQTALGWTAPESGFMIGVLSTISGSETAVLYVLDNTDNAIVYRVNTPENGSYTSASFPIIKGHSYKITYVSGAQYIHMQYYKYI